MRALALALLLSAPAAASEPAARAAQEQDDPAIAELRARLKDDPALQELLINRLLRSRISGMISQNPELAARREELKAWIGRDPDSAARIAMGLANDDRTGSSQFEDSLARQARTNYRESAGVDQTVFGRLRQAAKNSTLLKKQAEEMSEEERREIIRTLFEGEGAQSNKVAEQRDPNPKPGQPPGGGGPATAFSGYYDRLSGGNLRGYSPQLMALQSALNQRRPPGAPKLIETGKLDYQTLSFPGFGMAWDVGNLEKRLKADWAAAVARALGIALSAADWRDLDALEKRLLEKLRGKDAKLSPRLLKRAEALARAKAALEDFRKAADPAKSPDAITKGLLIELGRRQREAARWITAAALEEELFQLEGFEGFPGAELLAQIDAAPAPEATRRNYRREGEKLRQRAESVRANAGKALALLTGPDWERSLGPVDAIIAENQKLKRNLPRDMDAYSRVPFRIAQSRVRQARWREWLDELAVRWAPRSGYGRGVQLRRGRLARYLEVFARIAAGDRDGAHAALASAEPSR